ERDRARVPAPASLRGPPCAPGRRARAARPEPPGRGAGADPACPAGLGGQARRGGAPARPLAPDALPQARPLRDLMNGGPMDETLYALCLSTDPAVSSAVVAMLARIPSFAVTARELDYQLGPAEPSDVGAEHLPIVILADDAPPRLPVIEDVHKHAPATELQAGAPAARHG